MAGVSAKEIKNRIRSMESTRQITKAMEMVAASKLRRAQTQVLSARPYFQTLYAAIDNIVNSTRDVTSPYLRQRRGSKVLCVAIAGDRGLAGGYNSNVFKLVMSEVQNKEAAVLPIGRKAADFFATQNVPVLTAHDNQAAEVSVGDCFTVARQLSKRYLDGEFDEVRICYSEFVSVLSQIPKSLQLLPLIRRTAQQGHVAKSEILYEPDSAQVLDIIVPEYMGGILYGALCESRAAEHAARRTAMDAATQNADEMIAQLSLEFNRARQAAITQEITEIVAGAQA